MYTCRLCGEKFNHKRDVIIHLKRHIGEEERQQEQSTPAQVPQDLPSQEAEEKLQDTIFQCSVCSLQYIDKIEFERHLRRVHRQSRIYKCEKCKEAFVHRRSLHKHMESHSEPNQEGNTCKCSA